MSDKDMRNLFTSEEWTEIQAVAKPRPALRQIPELPDLDSLFKEGYKMLGGDDKFNAWLGHTLIYCHRLYDSSFLTASHSEATYVHIWSNFLDLSLLGRGLHISRGDIESNSIKELANKGRALGTRIANSPKFDGIVFSDQDPKHKEFEYGFHEASKLHAASYDTKLVSDSGKAVMAMRSAIVYASTAFEREEDLRAYEVISAVTSGLQLRSMHMSYGGGMVVLLQRSRPVTLPENFNPEKFRQVVMEVAAVSDMLLRNKSSPVFKGGAWAGCDAPFELPW